LSKRLSEKTGQKAGETCKKPDSSRLNRNPQKITAAAIMRRCGGWY
jgi:hypothetical protein